MEHLSISLRKKLQRVIFGKMVDSEVKVSGLKTDVLLRTIGTLYYSNVQDMKAYWEIVHESTLPKFAIQLFTILKISVLKRK